MLAVVQFRLYNVQTMPKPNDDEALPPVLGTVKRELEETSEKLADYAELERTNERLEAENASLKAEIAALRARLNGGAP